MALLLHVGIFRNNQDVFILILFQSGISIIMIGKQNRYIAVYWFRQKYDLCINNTNALSSITSYLLVLGVHSFRNILWVPVLFITWSICCGIKH